jgi:N-acetylglucosamine kinase-like BadF-type ATPase
VISQLNEKICGKGTFKIERIVGGDDAKKGDWGWTVGDQFP